MATPTDPDRPGWGGMILVVLHVVAIVVILALVVRR